MSSTKYYVFTIESKEIIKKEKNLSPYHNFRLFGHYRISYQLYAECSQEICNKFMEFLKKNYKVERNVIPEITYLNDNVYDFYKIQMTNQKITTNIYVNGSDQTINATNFENVVLVEKFYLLSEDEINNIIEGIVNPSDRKIEEDLKNTLNTLIQERNELNAKISNIEHNIACHTQNKKLISAKYLDQLGSKTMKDISNQIDTCMCGKYFDTLTERPCCEFSENY